MVPYHFFVIWLLALCSTATTFATLLALVQDFKRDWLLRWLRQFAMFVNLVLTIVYGIFVLQTNTQALAPTLPIACVWQEHARAQGPQSSSTLSIVATIAVIAGTGIIFLLGTWYLHMRQQRWGKYVRVVSILVLSALALGASARVIMVSQAFGTPNVPLSDQGEKLWSFGQLLTMMLLLLPFVSALEILRGERIVPHSCEMALRADTVGRRDASPDGQRRGRLRSFALDRRRQRVEARRRWALHIPAQSRLWAAMSRWYN